MVFVKIKKYDKQLEFKKIICCKFRFINIILPNKLKLKNDYKL